MALLKVDWAPPRRVYRSFGLSLAATGLVLGAILAWVWGALAAAPYVAGTLVVAGAVIALAPTPVARPVYLAFMGPMFVVGSVVSRVLVSAFFFLLVTPIGLVLRLVRRDPLRMTGRAESYWEPTESGKACVPEEYERRF